MDLLHQFEEMQALHIADRDRLRSELGLWTYGLSRGLRVMGSDKLLCSTRFLVPLASCSYPTAISR